MRLRGGYGLSSSAHGPALERVLQHNSQMVDCAEPPYNISGLFIYWPRVGVRCNRVLAVLSLGRVTARPTIATANCDHLRANVLREDVVVTAAAGMRASLHQVFQQRLNSQWFNTSGTGPNT